MFRTYRLIWEIFTVSERRKFLLVFLLAVVMSAFEVIGVAGILPLLRMLADPQLVHTNSILSWLKATSGLASDSDFLVLVGLLTFGVIVVSISFRAFATYALSRFTMMRSYSLGSRLLRGYLNQPYVWFISRNSSEFGQTLLSEVDTVVRDCILPAVMFLANSTVALFMAGLVFLIEPTIALSSFLLLVSVYIIIYLVLRPTLDRIGMLRLKANRERFHITNEATSGIKEVKIFGIEDIVLRRFRIPAMELARHQALGSNIGKLPRYALEAICYGGFIALVLVMFVQRGRGIADVLPVLGVVGMAGMRLLPALQQMYLYASAMRFSLSTLEKLHRDLGALQTLSLPGPVAARLPIKKSLELKDVVFRYPGAELDTLSKLSISIEAHARVGIVGRTGAGKTTAVDIIMGLLRPDAGAVVVDGAEITADLVRAWQRNIGYVPQHIFLSDDTIAANIAFGIGKDAVDMAAVERAARIANLHDFVMSELPDGYRTKVGERGIRLSGGQRQRIGIARALYPDPDVLVLDEATSALDSNTERVVMDALHNLGKAKTVIMIAHRLSTIEKCDIIFLLEKGRLEASGDYQSLIARSSRFREMAGGMADAHAETESLEP